jgi:C4-dicarboxylate-specific signal transduction histidine kinase
MPGMSGVELFEILHRNHAHTKRVMLTGYIDASAMLDAINRGKVFHFVTKPWQLESLTAVLIRALEAHRLELANSALTAQLMASQQMAMLGKSTARIAHEMANHLCVQPLLEHIEENYKSDAELLQLGEVVRAMFGRLAQLLDEIKSLARLNRQDATMMRLPLAEATRELISFLRYCLDVDSSRLEVEIHDEPVVLGNKLKIQQVLVNLIRNAAYAIRSQTDGRIRISLTAEERYALLVVEDNGCGIAPEIRETIWEPFFSTKGEEGNGLGLDVCREVVRSHHGEITCQSELRKGSRFSVWLPLLAKGIAAPQREDAMALPHNLGFAGSFGATVDSAPKPLGMA